MTTKKEVNRFTLVSAHVLAKSKKAMRWLKKNKMFRTMMKIAKAVGAGILIYGATYATMVMVAVALLSLGVGINVIMGVLYVLYYIGVFLMSYTVASMLFSAFSPTFYSVPVLTMREKRVAGSRSIYQTV